MIRTILFTTAALLSALAFAQQNPEKESYGPAQAAADVLMNATNADAAFLPAGMLNDRYEGGSLAGLIQFPNDEVVVVRISGQKVMEALQKSVSLFPSPNPGFLQVAGMDITFDPSRSSGNRVTSARIGGSPVDRTRDYRIAMPANLARGALGYFTIWSRDDIVSTLQGETLESLLRDRTGTVETSRWRQAS